ncbi:hypothetical protein BDW02DRAFT_568011 [Decorospora gaudefroyi]|uniref:Uncharacterized protein n=1 Tax=Decorospora gaudefroyi TaxID=184978 RepID=A0A6A5KIC4_9PLEO|nr:hypothetical protein BDW02DRAFT_568011 [Decorospora gaudefroyi]
MIDELLVHISAPTTRHNDELYRSLADEYLNFEAHTTHANGSRPEQHEAALRDGSGPNGTAALRSGPSFRGNADTSILSTSKDSYGSFPSHMSSDGQNRYDLVEDGSIPTSYRLARLERIHQNWKEQTSPKSSFLGGQRPKKDISSNPEDADTGFIEDTQLGIQALQSQLQDGYSTTDEDTSEDEHDSGLETIEDPLSSAKHAEREIGSIRAAKDSTHLPKANPEPKNVLVPSRASLRLNEADSTVDVSASARSSADLRSSRFIASSRKRLRLDDASTLSVSLVQKNTNGHESVRSTEAPAQVVDFTKLPIDAFPPVPKVSVERPSALPSQMTQHLAAVKNQNPTRFKPSKKMRTPRCDERGCWSINCSEWTEKLQQEFWISMCEQVASGRLGWGVTLHREAGSPRWLGQVRLYCWGEVVEPMWLVLWLCSRGKASGSSLKWFDAEEIVVFDMQ